ncbi:hypothetical protein TSOC_009919 [Tetrabaena socialis]|uniref:Protein SMG9 n=1 Tax=Tetrabaena socialis TaxID=47790 RepID=A0A2J7ZUM3_9CHLO|nr:hypothetical protein TSOC_009919 [Tetrabaena socialis]|eukprot:PNH03971.1 hypothetical protein TSOC_009919 [Tetrabaena socialis]
MSLATKLRAVRGPAGRAAPFSLPRGRVAVRAQQQLSTDVAAPAAQLGRRELILSVGLGMVASAVPLPVWDALSGATNKTTSSRIVDGNDFYDYDIESPEYHYLCTITVSSGKIFGVFVRSPTKSFGASEAKLRNITASFKLLGPGGPGGRHAPTGPGRGAHPRQPHPRPPHPQQQQQQPQPHPQQQQQPPADGAVEQAAQTGQGLQLQRGAASQSPTPHAPQQLQAQLPQLLHNQHSQHTAVRSQSVTASAAASTALEPQIYAAAQQQQQHLQQHRQLQQLQQQQHAVAAESLRLLDARWEFDSGGASKVLSDAGGDFKVVGVMGLQGAGKSTLLNALLHDSPAALAAAASGAAGGLGGMPPFEVAGGRRQQQQPQRPLGRHAWSHCTSSLEIRVHPGDRTVLLDSPPLWSASVLAELAVLSDAGGDFKVVGVMGLQGAGKSTLLNALLHDSPAALAAAASGAAGGLGGMPPFEVAGGRRQQQQPQRPLGRHAWSHCTSSLEIRVHPGDRTVLLDSPPLWSASVLAELAVVLMVDSLDDPRLWEYLQVIDMVAHALPDVAVAAAAAGQSTVPLVPAQPAAPAPGSSPARRVAELVLVLCSAEADTVRRPQLLQPQWRLLRGLLGGTTRLLSACAPEHAVSIFRHLGHAPGTAGLLPPPAAAPAPTAAAAASDDMAAAAAAGDGADVRAEGREAEAARGGEEGAGSGDAGGGCLHFWALPAPQPSEREWLRGVERLWGVELPHAPALDRYFAAAATRGGALAGGGGWPLPGASR